jgi:hypothetical protein
MFIRFPALFFLLAMSFPLAALAAAQHKAQEVYDHGARTVWNLDCGAYFATDGDLPNGTCFRWAGHVTAPDFFVGLRRFDDDNGTVYMRGKEIVRTFPEKLFVTFSIRDIPCTPDLKAGAAQPPLTPEMLSTLRFGLFWKNGVEMHLIRNYQRDLEELKPIEPYATDLAKDLPMRYVWTFNLTVPSKNVPITDSLVFILATPDGKLAARVSARL